MNLSDGAVQGLVSLGSIPREEIWKVRTALRFYRQDNFGGTEFSVRCRGNRRCWQIANDDIIVNINGGFARFTGTYELSADLIHGCTALSPRTTNLEITINGGSATATNPTGALTMAGGGVNTEFRVITQLRPVEARISQECLDNLAGTSPALPYEPYDLDETRDKFPNTTISIGENALEFTGKYNRFGYNSVTTTVPAITWGHGMISCLSERLNDALDIFSRNRQERDITITYDPVGGDFVELYTETEYVALRRLPTAADTKLE